MRVISKSKKEITNYTFLFLQWLSIYTPKKKYCTPSKKKKYMFFFILFYSPNKKRLYLKIHRKKNGNLNFIKKYRSLFSNFIAIKRAEKRTRVYKISLQCTSKV